MKTIIRYTLLTALRDYLFSGLYLLILATFGISFFLGYTALSEQYQMFMVYAAGSSRLIIISGLAIFICFHVRRSFDNREVALFLSRPISRCSYVISYWLSFVIIALLLIIPTVLLIYLLMNLFTATPYTANLFYWSLSLLAEAAIIIAFALMTSLILRSAVSAILTTIGFYALSRMMGFFATAAKLPESFENVTTSNGIEYILKIISILLPRLDLFGKTSWIIYDTLPHNLWVFQLQSLVYIPFLLVIAIYDFQRKAF